MFFRDALRLAQEHEMAQDQKVLVYGLDVDDHRGIFGSTLGLKEKFGGTRVFSTPLAEEAMTGFGIGAALGGYKPVHVHIRADFALLAINQLVNMASSLSYLSNGKMSVPLTIRTVVGRGWGQGPQHTKSIHSLISHFPGFKVLIPSSPQDAYSLLRYAIQDLNPVLFVEHRWLYDVEGPVDFNARPSFSQILRPGRDVTLITNGWMSVEALKAAEILQSSGINCEIVDVKQIAPVELSLVIESVKHTGRAVVIDHDWIDSGWSATIATRLQQAAWNELEAPIQTVGCAPFPCPTGREMEDQFYPKAPQIIEAVTKMLDAPPPDVSKVEFWSYENRFRGPF